MASIPFTIRQLEYFNAIASEGSLAAAAQRCLVSASALALAVDELEQHLRLQLFVRRKGKGVALTPAGARLLSHARLVLQGAESLAESAWQASSSLKGRFAIGCFSTLTPFLLPGIMEVFQRRHPELELDLTEAAAPELAEMLLQGRIDVALLYDTDVPPRLAFDPLTEVKPYVMVARDHPLASRRSVHLGELVSDPLILLDVHPSRPNTEHIFGALKLNPLIGHTTTNFELVRCLVARGLGYGVLFQRPLSPMTYDGKPLVVLEIDDRIPQTMLGLARAAGAPQTARHRALHEYLATAISAAPAR